MQCDAIRRDVNYNLIEKLKEKNIPLNTHHSNQTNQQHPSLFVSKNDNHCNPSKVCVLVPIHITNCYNIRGSQGENSSKVIFILGIKNYFFVTKLLPKKKITFENIVFDKTLLTVLCIIYISQIS